MVRVSWWRCEDAGDDQWLWFEWADEDVEDAGGWPVMMVRVSWWRCGRRWGWPVMMVWLNWWRWESSRYWSRRSHYSRHTDTHAQPDSELGEGDLDVDELDAISRPPDGSLVLQIDQCWYTAHGTTAFCEKGGIKMSQLSWLWISMDINTSLCN